MTVADFPLEVEELVIDHLHEEKATLGSCGLVCESWLKSSRYHLFGSVFLLKSNWRGFLQLINSPLATFIPSIHTLSISGASSDTTPYLNDIVPQLPDLPGLKSLRLYFLSWPHVRKATLDCLAHLVLNVTELILQRVDFRCPRDLVTVLSSFPRLQKVAVVLDFLSHHEPFGMPTTQSPDVPRNLQCVDLQGLHRDPAGQVITWLNAAVFVPPIRVLRLGCLTRNMAPLGKLLCVVGPDLRELELEFISDVTAGTIYDPSLNFNGISDSLADIKAHIDLSSNSSLQHLTLHLSIGEEDNEPWELLAALHCAVTRLTLDLSVSIVDADFDEFEPGRLDWTLKTHFPALQRLRIIIEEPRFEIPLRVALAEYDSRGVLEVGLGY
ncbi:hypothetical protein DFH06DRAFT_1486606 [Mycena polygramma]|nr:hypothetical protein DFH06DRAFT_1486606 [Mycena polygramma]